MAGSELHVQTADDGIEWEAGGDAEEGWKGNYTVRW